MNNNDNDDINSLVELDKIELPGVDAKAEKEEDVAYVVDIDDITPRLRSEKAAKAEPSKKRSRKAAVMAVLAVSILVLTAISYVIWQSTGKISSSPHQAATEQAIGPIIANIDQNKRIKIALNIKYNVEMTETSLMRLHITNDILMFLSSLDTRKKLAESSRNAQKKYIESMITSLIKSDIVDEVIFTQIEIY